MSKISSIITGFSILFLAACGGGGDASPDNDAAPEPSTQIASTSLGTTNATQAPAPETLAEEESAFAPVPAPVLAPTPAPDPTPVPAPVPPPPTAGTLDPTLTCGLADFEREVMRQVNEARASARVCGATQYGAAPAMAWHPALFAAAAGHSADMAANDYFSHTGRDGSSPGDRMREAGYPWRTYGENISAGRSTVETTIDGWMASPGHCANIMNPAFTEVAVACVKSGTSQYRTYWTMNLGRR